MYLLGYDIGSSSIKVALVEAATGKTLAMTKSPQQEMEILAIQEGWAEQDPDMWWQHVCLATQGLLHHYDIPPSQIKGIGIAYQMHGLVLLDQMGKVLRPSIIWCDSRAVAIGDQALTQLGTQKCYHHLLNSPGNFTASKLKWVKEHEPKLYAKIDKIMLPGDYIAYKLTGEIHTTISGLSEGMFWDFQSNQTADWLMEYFGFEPEVIPPILPTFSLQGQVTREAAEATGLAPEIPVTYRAGDQPNNALSLNVLEPGEIAATGGTSGVVYGVIDQPLFDEKSRVNGFAHVNHSASHNRIGILLCINGAGIQYSWLKHQMGNWNYPEMEQLAQSIPVGSEGLRILPFGNGAERMLGNHQTGAQVNNLQFNRHSQAHFFRAGLEGIAFSFVYGLKVFQEMGLDINILRVGNDNLFQSSVFSQTIANLIGSCIEVIDTNGAIGAAKAAGVATHIYASPREAMQKLEIVQRL
ncbi:MAG: FGGY family carbohydrate kinase, partial [Bacteroidota bacterium]